MESEFIPKEKVIALIMDGVQLEIEKTFKGSKELCPKLVKIDWSAEGITLYVTNDIDKK